MWQWKKIRCAPVSWHVSISKYTWESLCVCAHVWVANVVCMKKRGGKRHAALAHTNAYALKFSFLAHSHSHSHFEWLCRTKHTFSRLKYSKQNIPAFIWTAQSKGQSLGNSCRLQINKTHPYRITKITEKQLSIIINKIKRTVFTRANKQHSKKLFLFESCWRLKIPL